MTISTRSSRPIRLFADTGTSGVSPPYSSTTIPASVSSVLTRSGFASGLSILLSAMMIGTFAALAWLIASSVWGMTPSSAATTTIAMSVTLAPRARIAVNASWPGVSRKTTRRPSLVTSLAPMCWVIPPRSPAATVVDRIASSRLVLPWSTWPMTVTIGARETRFASSASVNSSSFAASDAAPSAPSSEPPPLAVRLRLGDLVAELAGDERRGVAIDELVDGGEDPALDELADDVGGIDPEQVGELLDGDRGRQLDGASLARVRRLDARPAERAVPSRRLAGPATAAGAAPTPGHGLLLR